MADPSEVSERGGPWVREVCAALDVPAGAVDIPRILDLTREISHRKTRPLGPVGAFILGMAVARHPDADPAELYDRMLATLPEPDTEEG
ncbi:hypothetical protein N864_05325 [Intrasporangium chromatireducens Q5-1]|uniref:DUF6457 domain-containing protein n=1 Tax=Intrasporangium chromatireducens Q5-1 TaxID=584657 RepID=W9GKI1_9MICO|nr:DUF6457 domain-containing protein [Intrasporangium chromatireducens]EWT05333.1 hypothetical protein N864_05325 [Intrasporangium chromatireducens Q5-1]